MKHLLIIILFFISCKKANERDCSYCYWIQSSTMSAPDTISIEYICDEAMAAKYNDSISSFWAGQILVTTRCDCVRN